MDIQIVRTLIDAAANLRDRIERGAFEFRCVVFMRNDVYEHLIKATSDRGKDSTVNLQWNDDAQFKRLVADRLRGNTGRAEFSELWSAHFEAHVKGEESFHYILSRTLRRPRDLLNFLKKSIQISVNRGHERCTDQDIMDAEVSYSEDLLQELVFEMSASGVAPEFVIRLAKQPPRIERAMLELEIEEAGVAASKVDEQIRRLVWFGFLGFAATHEKDDALFAYETGHDLRKLEVRRTGRNYRSDVYSIHPGFRRALQSDESDGLF